MSSIDSLKSYAGVMTGFHAPTTNFFRYSRFHCLLGRYDVPKPHFDALNVRQVTLNNQVLSPWLAEFERVFPKRKISKKGNQPSLFVLPKKNLQTICGSGYLMDLSLFGDLLSLYRNFYGKKKTFYTSRFPNLDIASRSSFLAAIRTGASGEPQLFSPGIYCLRRALEQRREYAENDSDSILVVGGFQGQTNWTQDCQDEKK